MNTASYGIEGGDFDRAGSASRHLKEMLKKVGVEPGTVRRAMIAAYEAEINVVIHARKGVMDVLLYPDRLDVAVRDEGPGIPDIDRAMQEGFSTAPPAARKLGFGAGMGLPSIKKNSDTFGIETTQGQGTRLHFSIGLQPLEVAAVPHNSLRAADGLCRECLHCLRVCPTRALRVRGGRPEILDHLCIDCTACIEVCRTGALSMDCAAGPATPSEEITLVLPTPFLTQFGAGIHPRQVVDALRGIGFGDVIVTEAWERALHKAVLEYARGEGTQKPVIAPVCPAVENLIETQFPSLIGNLAPFLSPLEAVQRELAGHDAVYMVGCPAQHTALTSKGSGAKARVISPRTLRNAILPLVVANDDKKTERPGQAPREGQDGHGLMRVSGIGHVKRVLEEVETGLLPDVSVLEFFACDQGCFGSPLWREDPFIAEGRWEFEGADFKTAGRALRRKRPSTARAGTRLDADMSKAIMKLGEIDALMQRLPGKDCALCGAPTCSALAEDIVLGRAELTACRHLGNGEGEPRGTE